MLNPIRVIAKGIKSCTYCFYVRCATLIVRVRGMPWHQTRATHYHADLGLPDKSRAIKGLVVCYVVWLVSIKGMGLRTCARCLGIVRCFGHEGYRAHVLHIASPL